MVKIGFKEFEINMTCGTQDKWDQRMQSVVDQVNEWLEKNPELTVINVETETHDRIPQRYRVWFTK
jgi:hypothetical protein